MLFVAKIKKERQNQMTENENNRFGLDKLKVLRSNVPAITHVDYSARIQTVSEKTNPLYYNMISQFEKVHNCAVIINTSFNVRGEPLVCTDMDYLIIENCLLDKKKQQNLFKNDLDWQKEYELD